MAAQGWFMHLYLVQHGEAKSEEDDPQRGLTEKGRQDIEMVAAYAKRIGVKVNKIFHSGKTRALQTAEILDRHLKPKDGFFETDGLAPLDEPSGLADRISRMDEDIIVVGHLPYLSRLASLLLCGNKEKEIVEFKNGGIVSLKRLNAGCWSIEWAITPDIIR